MKRTTRDHEAWERRCRDRLTKIGPSREGAVVDKRRVGKTMVIVTTRETSKFGVSLWHHGS